MGGDLSQATSVLWEVADDQRVFTSGDFGVSTSLKKIQNDS